MKTVTLPGGEHVPALGLGTWRMGENDRMRDAEVAAIRHAINAGVQLIDTAEMYGEGGAESVLGEAMIGHRDDLFIVSKVYPHNASYDGAIAACERSLKRLGTDRIDLYLLHWPGSTPLEETISGFEDLVRGGKIRHWGVSNFDTDLIQTLHDIDGGSSCAANQVLYHLGIRGIEWDLLPWCQNHAMPVMAYSPLGQGEILDHPALAEVAERHDVAPAAIALAWSIRLDGVISIPKSVRTERIDENLAAMDVDLTAEDLATLDEAFSPPDAPSPLYMI